MAETGDDNYEDDGQKQDNKGGPCSLMTWRTGARVDVNCL
jgi:hypothetical protein